MGNKVLDEIAQRLSRRGLPALWPPFEPTEWMPNLLKELSPGELFDAPVTQPDFALAVEAGLLLWAGCLDESHHISQTISNSTGSYWHGLMHRCEPDYPNSHYWFHRVGEHPAFDSVYARALADLARDESKDAHELEHHMKLWSRWIPEEFIALCQEARERPASEGEVRALKMVQAA